MSWHDFQLALSYFIIGVAIGCVWNPVWAIFKKIWHEAKVAQNEWQKKSNNKDT